MKSFILTRSWLMAIIMLAGLAAPVPSFAGDGGSEGWEVRRESNGVKVFSRKSDVSSIDELKVELTINSSLSSIVAVLMDAGNFPNWVYGCDKSRVIRQVSQSEQYQYQLMSAPFPFSDRDVINHFSVRQDAASKTVYTTSIAVPDYLPVSDDAVRLPFFDGRYELKPIAGNEVMVTYILSLDPGGNLPDWLVNLTFVNGPYESLRKLRSQVALPQYKDRKLPFIQEL